MPTGSIENVVKKEIIKVIKDYNQWLRKNYKEEWKKILNK